MLIESPVVPVVSPVTEVLLKMRTLLADRTRWCKGERKRSPYGVVGKEPSYCLLGAIHYVVTDDAWGAETSLTLATKMKLSRLIERKRIGTGIASYNDNCNTTHTEVLALLDQAIAEQHAR